MKKLLFLLLSTAALANIGPFPGGSGGGGGSGTVTSVGLADASTSPVFTITNSPVTTSGTLTETLATQSANKVFAGATSGGAVQPTFRSLVAADIPSLSYVNAVGAFSSSGQTNGATISGSTITFGISDSTHPGMVPSGLTASQAVVTDGSSKLASLAYSFSPNGSALVQRDSNGNTAATNSISGSTNIVSAGTTTTLTAGSNRFQKVTGTLNQTIVLPDATTLINGWVFEVNVNTSGTVTINKNGGTLVTTGGAGSYVVLYCTDNSSSAGVWDYHWLEPSNSVYNTAGLSVTGTLTASGNVTVSNATASTVPYLDASKIITSSSVTPTELGYVSGVTSSIQTQLNAKGAGTVTGTGVSGDLAGWTSSSAIGDSTIVYSSSGSANFALFMGVSNTITSGSKVIGFGTKLNTAGAQSTVFGNNINFDQTEMTGVGNNICNTTHPCGGKSVWIGDNLGDQNTLTDGGSQSVFIGNEVAHSSSNMGSFNVEVGEQVAYSGSAGSNNVLLGGNAGYSSASASSMVCVGYASCFQNSAHDSIYLGRSSYTTTPIANALIIGGEGGSTDGAIYDVYIGQTDQIANASLHSLTYHATSTASGVSNQSAAAGTVIFNGAQGTGTGVGGDIYFQVAPLGGSGSSLNSLVEAFRVKANQSVTVTAASTTLTGSAGTAVCSEPFQGGGYTRVMCYLSGYTDTATQSYTFPVAFSHTPAQVYTGAGITLTTASTTTLAITSTLASGYVILEGN